MRLGILAALVCLPLTACGDDADPSAPEAGKVALVSGPAAGGQGVTTRLERLDTPERLAAFAGKFREPLTQQIKDRAADVEVAEGQVLAGAKVFEGCFEAVSAAVQGSELVGEPDPQEEDVQCIASITTVGLVAVPEGELGPAS